MQHGHAVLKGLTATQVENPHAVIGVWRAEPGRDHQRTTRRAITALKTMRHAKVRRLPVVNAEGWLQGILCLNDIALRAEEAHGKHVPELSCGEAVSTFKALCEHRAATLAAHA